MKSFLIFVFGVVVGILSTILFGFLVVSNIDEDDEYNGDLSGLTIFEEKGECITRNTLEVFQVVEPHQALAYTGHMPDDFIVFLTNDEGDTYFDGQQVEISSGQCARQIGLFKYATKLNIGKTVPVVVIE